MADFVHLRRVYVSQRLTRGRRDFDTAALDFRAQQHLLSKSHVLDPDYAVKVLNPEEERESEKRIPGGYTKPPEIRFDPKATRQPGQILKLHVTAEDMLDESDKPNFGWVDPPTPKNFSEHVLDLAKEPKIRIREYGINPRTGGMDEDNYRDMQVKSLGDKIGGGGRSLIGRAARRLGMIVDDLGKFRCPPGTPNANQFTDITGSTCFPSLRRVQGAIDNLMGRMGVDWGANPYHGVDDDVAARIGIGWGDEKASELARSSIAEQMRAGVASARMHGVSTVEQARRHHRKLQKNVKKLAKKLGIELPDDLNADLKGTYGLLQKAIQKAIDNGTWTNGLDRDGNPLPAPKLTITSLQGLVPRDGLPDAQKVFDARLTEDLISAMVVLGNPEKNNMAWLGIDSVTGRSNLPDVTREDFAEYERGGDLYNAVEQLRNNWLTNANGTMFAHLEMLERDQRTGSNNAGVVGELVLGVDRPQTGGITHLPGQPARVTINLLDATFKQYYKKRKGTFTQIIAEGDMVEGKKWEAIRKFLKNEQHRSPFDFMDVTAGKTPFVRERTREEMLDGDGKWRASLLHSQDFAEGLFGSRFAGAMQVTYHEYTHAMQQHIFFERVASKLSADGKYTIYPRYLYGTPRLSEPKPMSLYPTEEHLNDPKFTGAEVGVAFSHWTNDDIMDAVVSEMLAEPGDDFPPTGMPVLQDSMLDLLAGERLSTLQALQRRGAWQINTESEVLQSERRAIMYLEATAELNAQRHMGIIGGPVIDGHLAYLDAPTRPVRAQHITEGQVLINEADFPEFVNPPGKPNRLRVVQANAEGRPIRATERAGPQIESMHARGVGSRGDGAQVSALINEEFGFGDGPMDTIDPDLLDDRFRKLDNTFNGLDQDRELSPNEKMRMFLAARGMEMILNENARRSNASDDYKDKLAHNGKPLAPGQPRKGQWTDDYTRSLRSDTDELFEDLSGSTVFRPPSIRATDEAISIHTATRRAIMEGGLSDREATAIDANLPAKHHQLADPEKLAERIRLNAAAARHAEDHGIEISTSPDEPSPHLDREIVDFIAPAMKVIDDNPLPESITVRVTDEKDSSTRQVGDVVKRDFTVGTASSHAHSDRQDRMEPGEGTTFRIELQEGDKGIFRKDPTDESNNGLLLPPSEFEVTSIEDNGDVVLAPIRQHDGPGVLRNIEQALDEMPGTTNQEESRRRDLLRNVLRKERAEMTTLINPPRNELPADDREMTIYGDPSAMPPMSVVREFNELAGRYEAGALTSGERRRMLELGRYIRMRRSGDPDLPDPDNSEPQITTLVSPPMEGLDFRDQDLTTLYDSPGGFRSTRADIDLDENGIHTASTGLRMAYNRGTGEWQTLEIRRSPKRDSQGRSLLEQYTGRVDENGEGIWEDLPLVANADGIMFQWDGERWRPDLSQVPDEHFHPEIGLVIDDGNGNYRRYDPETQTFSDWPVYMRDASYVPNSVRSGEGKTSDSGLRHAWKLRHSGLKMRDSRLGDGTTDDSRDILPPLITDIMYHGTPHDFAEFQHGHNISGAGVSQSNKNPDSGLGFHFSPFEQTAEMMSNGGFIKTVHLDLRNPAAVEDLTHLQKVRDRATISALGLDELYESIFQAHLDTNHPGAILEGNTPFERLVHADKAIEGTFNEYHLARAFMQEITRVRDNHVLPHETNQYKGGPMGWDIPNLETILTPEQIEELSPMLFRSFDKEYEPGEGSANDLITREWLKEQGYDGIVIKEAWMGPPFDAGENQVGKHSTGDPRQVSYVVFEPEQITTAEPPQRTPEQQAYRDGMLSQLEQGAAFSHAGKTDGFTPFDVEVSVGDEVLFSGGERQPGSGKGGSGKIFEDNFWKNHGEAAWQRDRERTSLTEEARGEYERVGGLASRRNGDLKASLGEQQEQLMENMRSRRRTQDEDELAGLTQDFEYLANIERRDRREFNRNNREGLKSSRGSADRGARTRMQDKDKERQAARVENGVGGVTGDIFNPDDAFVEQAIEATLRPLGGGIYDWTHDTRENKIGRALDSAKGAIGHFREGGGIGDVPLPKAVRTFIAGSTDEEVLDRLREAAREYVSDFDPRIRIAAKGGKVDEILADPDRRYKSTHEAQSTHSLPNERRELELTWGVPLDAPASVRPVSGALNHKEYRKLKTAWLQARKSGRPDFGNTVDPDFLPDYWSDNGISPSGPATWVYGGGQTGGAIEFVLKADRANDSGVVFGDSALQGAKRPTSMTSTSADDLLAAILYPETTVSSNHVGRNRKENQAHVMSLLNGSLTGDWSGVLDPDTHRRAAQQGVSPAQAAGVSHRYAEALVPGGFDFEDVEHVSMPVGTFNAPEDLAPGDMGRNNQEVLDALEPFNLSDEESDRLFSDYGSSGHLYATYMRNYLGMLEKKRELRKLGLETVFPNHDAIDYFDPETWLSLAPTAWGKTPPNSNSNVYELLQHLVRADIIKRRQTLVNDIRRPTPVYDPTVSVV